jgi:hypothetical protein
LLDAGIEKAFAENALAHHAGCPEEDHVHGFMLQRGRCLRYQEADEGGAGDTAAGGADRLFCSP